MNDTIDSLWMLQCKNAKCNELFDYFGRLSFVTSIACTHCGKSSRHGVGDFTRYNQTDPK